MDQPNEKPRRPFFARFLEEQALDAVRGAGNWTLKGKNFDWDESLPNPTMKYPSDTDDVRVVL
jgi:hypothetical protein